MPMSSSGTCRAVRASRPQSLTAGRVRPLQVVDDEHHGPGGGLVDGQRDELLGEHRGHVGAAVGGDLAAQQPGDRGPARVRGRAAHAQRVEERQQRQFLAELVARAPELLAASLLPVPRCLGGGRERAADEGGLADARLTLDEHRVATAPGKIY